MTATSYPRRAESSNKKEAGVFPPNIMKLQIHQDLRACVGVCSSQTLFCPHESQACLPAHPVGQFLRGCLLGHIFNLLQQSLKGCLCGRTLQPASRVRRAHGTCLSFNRPFLRFIYMTRLKMGTSLSGQERSILFEIYAADKGLLNFSPLVTLTMQEKHNIFYKNRQLFLVSFLLIFLSFVVSPYSSYFCIPPLFSPYPMLVCVTIKNSVLTHYKNAFLSVILSRPGQTTSYQ